jgi:hypothetical protein
LIQKNEINRKKRCYELGMIRLQSVLFQHIKN